MLEDLRDRGELIDQMDSKWTSNIEVAMSMFKDVGRLHGSFMDLADCAQTPVLHKDWMAPKGIENFHIPCAPVCAM